MLPNNVEVAVTPKLDRGGDHVARSGLAVNHHLRRERWPLGLPHRRRRARPGKVAPCGLDVCRDLVELVLAARPGMRP